MKLHHVDGTPDDMFVSCVRADEDLAGVFEFDGVTGYFYLCKMGEDERVLSSMQVSRTAIDFTEEDVLVRWNSAATAVGLFIRNELWAVFDVKASNKAGGGYAPGESPTLRASSYDFGPILTH